MQPMDFRGMSNSKLLCRAHGKSVFSTTEVQALQAKSSKFIRKRITFFNGRDAWLWRRNVRKHNVIRSASRYSILYSSNSSRDMLRSKPRLVCIICGIKICTRPREEGDGLSCLQEWHRQAKLTGRILYSNPKKVRHASAAG